MIPQQQIGSFEATTHDEFLDQMLSSLPSTWNEDESSAVQFDESSMLVSKLRHHQINGMSSAQSQMLQHQQLNGDVSSSLFNPSDLGLESSIHGLYNGFTQTLQSPQFVQSQHGAIMNQAQGIESGGSAPAQPRQRVRARRGQATDPHSIAERLRRERIAERMKGLQELVPNANKTDKASMLDEIIDYVKFLQLQVKVLSMSRLGGTAAVAPLVPEQGDAISKGAQTTDDKAMTMTEEQVAKLMEEDMGSAMQYLQGKGLCLMPISLANAISTATSHTLPHNNNYNNANGMFLANENGTTSPTASVLTVQSSALLNDATSGLC